MSGEGVAAGSAFTCEIVSSRLGSPGIQIVKNSGKNMMVSIGES